MAFSKESKDEANNKAIHRYMKTESFHKNTVH